MGFDELGRSLLNTNENLRNRLRHSFLSKKLNSHSANLASPIDREELTTRMKRADQLRLRKITWEFLLLAIIALGLVVMLLAIRVI